jgi:hypothetical protein
MPELMPAPPAYNALKESHQRTGKALAVAFLFQGKGISHERHRKQSEVTGKGGDWEGKNPKLQEQSGKRNEVPNQSAGLPSVLTDGWHF